VRSRRGLPCAHRGHSGSTRFSPRRQRSGARSRSIQSTRSHDRTRLQDDDAARNRAGRGRRPPPPRVPVAAARERSSLGVPTFPRPRRKRPTNSLQPRLGSGAKASRENVTVSDGTKEQAGEAGQRGRSSARVPREVVFRTNGAAFRKFGADPCLRRWNRDTRRASSCPRNRNGEVHRPSAGLTERSVRWRMATAGDPHGERDRPIGRYPPLDSQERLS